MRTRAALRSTESTVKWWRCRWLVRPASHHTAKNSAERDERNFRGIRDHSPNGSTCSIPGHIRTQLALYKCPEIYLLMYRYLIGLPNDTLLSLRVRITLEAVSIPVAVSCVC
jgi:hypothetical protein